MPRKLNAFRAEAHKKKHQSGLQVLAVRSCHRYFSTPLLNREFSSSTPNTTNLRNKTKQRNRTVFAWNRIYLHKTHKGA
jgi:hypothetical protein